ncbi:MAG: UDP-glucose 4-epimerase GalE [Planctomycetota bacterium]|nr:UDP-glucose 4-epimerase GalE [Planctomycetota bacterium]
MKLLVVGGAGYIGSHTVRRLNQQGHQVLVFDNLCTGHRQAVPSGQLIVGELTQVDYLSRVLRDNEIEAVLHFAAFALVGESVADPALYYQNNVAGTLSLLDAMRSSGVSRIVFSSTTATYGTPQQLPITEQEPQHPINPYGFSKLVIERVLDDYASAYGMAYAALRYFNAAGASPKGDLGEDHTPESHLIPIILQVALGQRSNVTLFGDDYPTRDGTCIRDYIHVDDLANAHLLALEKLAPGKGLRLNLGSGSGYSVKEILDMCRKITGHAIPASIGARRAGDPPELVADASRARDLLDWTPRYSDLQTIVETAWHWHRAHPTGYSS